jgi:hypothetical protein
MKPSREGFQFATWFDKLRPDTITSTKSEITKWAEDYDRLLRLDGKTKDRIKAVCEWARRDDFWKDNFLSPMKLRKKNRDGVKYFDVFETKMKTEQKANQPKLTTAEANGF